MKSSVFGLAVSAVLLSSAAASAQGQSQYPVADEIANKVIAKYQSASCDQLAAQKQQAPSGQKAAIEQKAVQQLKQNPQMREYFINKIAAPIANKMFDCGMIP